MTSTFGNSGDAGRRTGKVFEEPHASAQACASVPAGMDGFRELVRAEGARLYRDLPWRRTRDPYIVWLSEVMLQQTQVSRVDGRWQRWLERFPTIDALAAADRAEKLAHVFLGNAVHLCLPFHGPAGRLPNTKKPFMIIT